jgi:hypothetical protein
MRGYVGQAIRFHLRHSYEHYHQSGHPTSIRWSSLVTYLLHLGLALLLKQSHGRAQAESLSLEMNGTFVREWRKRSLPLWSRVSLSVLLFGAIGSVAILS